MVAGRYLREATENQAYAVAHNLRLALRDQVSQALTKYDCLLDPDNTRYGTTTQPIAQ
jgi:hypothetical protein